MKKFYFFCLLIIGSFFVGCAKEDSSIVSPMTQEKSAVEKPDWQKAAEAQGLQLITLPASTENSLKKSSEVQKYIYANRGGTLSLFSSYKSDKSLVVIIASLKIYPYSLEQNGLISMGFNDEFAVADISLDFGPSGISFKRPALLNVIACGLDLSGWASNDTPKLACYNEDTGAWEIVPAQKIIFNVKTGYLQCINGQLSHFSRYGFVK